MKTKKNPGKPREWEKIRRDKLNESFGALSKLLPNYDPSITLSKSDILRKAASYIEELHQKIKDMGVKEGIRKTTRIEIKSLYERIKKLLQRNEQLCTFIRDAGMKVPNQYGNIKQFKRPLRWDKKITEEKAKELSEHERESQKENQEIDKRSKKISLKAIEKRNINRKYAKKVVKEVRTAKRKLVATVQIPNVIQKTVSNVALQSCFIISNSMPLNLSSRTGENKSSAATVVTSSASAAPKVSSIINPPTIPSNTITNLNSLSPGTLILANGNVVRILPQPSPIIIKPPPPPPPNNLVILTTTTSIFTKSFTHIRPKLKAITRTTQINKVPIPALTSHFIPKKKCRAVKRKIQKSSSLKENSQTIKPTENIAKETDISDKDLDSKVEDEGSRKPTEEKLDEPPPDNDKAEVTPEVVKETSTDKVPETTEQVAVTTETVPDEPESESEPKQTPVIDDKTKPCEDHLELGMNLNSELSNDIFSSLQVPIGSQNPESTSPTAAFLLAFPLVSSLTGVKVTEVIEEENSSSHHGTPTLLQIGTMDTTKTTQSESLTPNLLNLDNFSFFSGYSSFDYSTTTTTVTTTTTTQTTLVTSKTFSTEEIPAKTNFSCAQENTSVTYSKVGTVSTPYVQCDNQEQKSVVSTTKPYVVTTAQCNTFSTFSDFSKPSNTYPTNFTRSYTDPLYTNSTNYNYNQNNYNNNQYYLTRPNTTTTYQRYNYYSTTKTTQAAKEKYSPPKNKNQPKPPINWMTTPDFRGNTSDYIVPSVPTFSKDLEYNPSNTFYPPVVSTHTNYFNNTNSHEFQQNTQFEENQFSWSPTKLPQYLDTSHGFVTTTLPTLIGDLALGTTQNNLTEQNMTKNKDRNKQRVNPSNYDSNPGNFLSVSQLVEHKNDRNSNRRNNRHIKANNKLKKPSEISKDLTESDKKQTYPNWMADCSKPIRHGNKNSQNYSAEALIGHQDPNENPGNRQRYRQNFTAPPNKTLPIPTYLADNIVPPYFPPVEISQENFIPSNQNYQNFAQNTSSYLPDFSTPHDFTNSSHRTSNDCSLKKIKHKPSNENLSMDFGFLSMPSSINSPILPDDFHTHANFLPAPTPNQLYPCKNPLYPKQSSELLSLPPVPGSRSNAQQFENMPGSSLTNFNLSAIFPEMNKGSGMYSSEATRNKNYNFHYLGSSVQTTFHNKSTVPSSSYINTTATTFAPSN